MSGVQAPRSVDGAGSDSGYDSDSDSDSHVDLDLDDLLAEFGSADEVAGHGEGAAAGDADDAHDEADFVLGAPCSRPSLSDSQREQIVAVFGEDLAARYLGVTAETRDAVLLDLVAFGRERNPDVSCAQLEMGLDLLVFLNSGKTPDEHFLRRMMSQAQAVQDQINEDFGAGAGASPVEILCAGMRKMLMAPGATDFEQLFGRMVLARVASFERGAPEVRNFDPLALCCSERSSRMCDASDELQGFGNFVSAMGDAISAVASAHARGESLPADAVLFLMGGVGLTPPRLSLLPIQEWTSEYLGNLARVARAEDLSVSVERYSAAQNVLEAGQAVLSSESSFTVVSAQTIRLHDAIEKYLALRGGSMSVVSARR